MKRDMVAIRSIILAAEESDTFIDKVEGLDDSVFRYNAMLLIEANLAIGEVFIPDAFEDNSPIPVAVNLMRLTWDGHDFADQLKNETIWNDVKKRIIGPGISFSFEMVKELLKIEMKNTFGV